MYTALPFSEILFVIAHSSEIRRSRYPIDNDLRGQPGTVVYVERYM